MDAAVAASPVEANPIQERGMLARTILVVDDQPEFLQLAQMILSSHPGVAIVGAARSGAEAVALVGKLRPEVVVVDVQMPGMNGFEAARRLRQVWPETQVVMMSAVNDYRYQDLARIIGAEGFIAKAQLSAEAILGVTSGE